MIGYGNWLMKITQWAWKQDRVNFYNSYSGYDGCFFDMLGIPPVENGGSYNYASDDSSCYHVYATPFPTEVVGVSRLPVNPNTGNDYTVGEWLSHTAAVAKFMKDNIPSTKIVSGNGLKKVIPFQIFLLCRHRIGE